MGTESDLLRSIIEGAGSVLVPFICTLGWWMLFTNNDCPKPIDGAGLPKGR